MRYVKEFFEFVKEIIIIAVLVVVIAITTLIIRMPDIWRAITIFIVCIPVILILERRRRAKHRRYKNHEG